MSKKKIKQVPAKPLTKVALLAKIKALGEISKEQRNSIACSLIGHSRIVTLCFGYVSCARCGDQIGDTLGGSSSLEDRVIVGHACPTCQSNFVALGWQDRLYVGNPFPPSEG